MKKYSLCLLLLLGTALAAFTQSSAPPAGITSEVKEQRKLLALSTVAYPVTPGDVYVLTYNTASGPQAIELVVPGDYQVNLTIFGNVAADGLTALSFMRTVEDKARNAYPQGRPNCVLKAVGIFTVFITGEVGRSGEIECWGLTTLAEVLAGRTTPHASFRKVTVVSGKGASATYDLFLATRFGKRDQNPYVRPGDRVIVGKALRRVTVGGEVFRPGTYELLPGEGLKVLIDYYADGFTEVGDPARIYVSRTLTEGKERGESFIIDRATPSYAGFSLTSLDEVTVPGKQERFGVVYFEGAVGVPKEAHGEKDAVAGRYPYRLTGDESLSAVLREVKGVFSPVADLARAYIIRSGRTEPIAADIERLLYDYSPENDPTLRPGDRIIIPLRQYFVTVSGAVFLPGRYPYVPDKSYRYYLALAGGSDPQKNVNDSVAITDARDAKQPFDRIIQPEDKIFVEFNNGLYHFQQWGVVLGTAISFGALVVGIIQLTR